MLCQIIHGSQMMKLNNFGGFSSSVIAQTRGGHVTQMMNIRTQLPLKHRHADMYLVPSMQAQQSHQRGRRLWILLWRKKLHPLKLKLTLDPSAQKRCNQNQQQEKKEKKKVLLLEMW